MALILRSHANGEWDGTYKRKEKRSAQIITHVHNKQVDTPSPTDLEWIFVLSETGEVRVDVHGS